MKRIFNVEWVEIFDLAHTILEDIEKLAWSKLPPRRGPLHRPASQLDANELEASISRYLSATTTLSIITNYKLIVDFTARQGIKMDVILFEQSGKTQSMGWTFG